MSEALTNQPEVHLPDFQGLQNLLAKKNDPAAYLEAVYDLGRFPRAVLWGATRLTHADTEYRTALYETMDVTHVLGADASHEEAVRALCLLGCTAMDVLFIASSAAIDEVDITEREKEVAKALQASNELIIWQLSEAAAE